MAEIQITPRRINYSSSQVKAYANLLGEENHAVGSGATVK
jgi:hypothetical protein